MPESHRNGNIMPSNQSDQNDRRKNKGISDFGFGKNRTLGALRAFGALGSFRSLGAFGALGKGERERG